jgi:hypothetical protein
MPHVHFERTAERATRAVYRTIIAVAVLTIGLG